MVKLNQARKALLIPLGIAMILMSVSACTAGKGGTDTQSQTTAASGIATTQQTTAAAVENFNEAGYPIVNEPITITVCGPLNAATQTWKGMNLFEHFTKLTGIQFEFEEYAATVWKDKKSLIFASNDLPDLFIAADFNEKESLTYGGNGQLIALNNLISSYCPNIRQAFEEIPEAKAMSTSGDGNIYTLPLVNQMPRDMHARYWINTKWLKNVGMEVPATLDEYYNVLVAFKEKDANGNGNPNDEIPVSGLINDATDAIDGLVLNALGINAQNGKYYMVATKDGKVACKNILPEYKEYLKFMNRLYTEKLMDNDIFVQTKEQFEAKGHQGTLGSFYYSASYIACGEEIGYDYTQFDALTSSFNSTKMVSAGSGIAAGKASITSANKYPEATIRLLDYCFSEEGSRINRNGEEDIGWKWVDKAAGTWENLCPEGYENTQVWRAAVTAIESFPSWYRVEYQNGQGSKNAIWLNEMTMKYSYPYFVTRYPTLSFTDEELSIISPIENDIKSYVAEMRAKFITSGGIDEAWDDYVATIEKMGINRVIEINQLKYDQYTKALK